MKYINKEHTTIPIYLETSKELGSEGPFSGGLVESSIY